MSDLPPIDEPAPVDPVRKMWIHRLNAVLGSMVVTVGFWMMWGELSPVIATAFALSVAGFLVWRGRSIALIWAWATLLVGLESLAWPITTTIRIRMETAQPTDEQMDEMVGSIVGLPFAIFWTTFAYGIFRLAGAREAKAQGSVEPPGQGGKGSKSGKKKRKAR